MKKILFTGGGSAGHVFPNVALMEELLSSGEADVCYMGTNGIEKTVLAEWKIPYYEITCPKLVRGGGFKGFKQNLGIPFFLSKAIKQAQKGLAIFQPDLVFSKGGYVALPVVLAAKKLGIPCMCHESDFSAGLANRMSAGKCQTVFTSFPETAKTFKNGKYSGAPIRRSILSAKKAESRKFFDIPVREKVLLIFGGGSGAAALNDAVRKHLKTLVKSYTILHVCGKGNVIENNLKRYRQFEFVKDMGMAYACADVVVSRAGSNTVFEILAMKKPSVLVPLAAQTRGDQAENAAYFERQGLCYVLEQSRLNELCEYVEKAFCDKKLQERLYSAAFARGNERILREIRQFLSL